MQKLIQFYTAYGGYLDGYFTFTFMAMLVMMGISVMNEFNDKNEKDITGKNKLLVSLFMTSLIFFSMRGWASKDWMRVVSAIFGFGANALIRKWKKNKIWDKYDFISKGGKK